MKPTIFLLLILLATMANAQINSDSLKPISRKPDANGNFPLEVYKNPLAATTGSLRKQVVLPSPLTDADYYLAGAVIKITTGSDNKEANNSLANFYIRPRKSNGQIAYMLEGYANEIIANELTALRLNRVSVLEAPQNSLQYFKQNGLSVLIAYANKAFCTDAWKIENITVTLEFKDTKGNPAPGGYGNKTINFPVSTATLGFVFGCNPFFKSHPRRFSGYVDQKLKMLLKTDEYFNPMPAVLMSWTNDDVN